MENQQDKPIVLRINITNDNHSISHSEWLKCNDEFKDLGIVFEISDKGYPSMVMTPYNLTYIDIASWVAIGKESHNIAIGRIKRMTSLCFFQMGIPANHHLIEDVYISYIDDDDNIPSIIYIY